MTRRLALVTGASAGIGAAFARTLAAQGWDLALTARRRDRLETLAAQLKASHGAESLVLPADLADPAAPAALLAEIEKAGRPIGMLINNAGYGLPGAFLNTTWADQAAFHQVMTTAPTELCHRVLPQMAGARFGRIVNVASLAGLLPGARGHTLYAAAKAFLVRLSQSLHAECFGTGIHVSALCPGFTYSEFHDVNGTRGQVSQMPRWMWMTAEQVVDAGLRGVEANDPVVVPGAPNKGIAAIARLLPEPLAMALVRQNSDRFRRME